MDALVDPDEAPELKRQRPSAGVLNEMAAEDLGGVAPGAVPARPATAADEAALRRAAGQKNMDRCVLDTLRCCTCPAWLLRWCCGARIVACCLSCRHMRAPRARSAADATLVVRDFSVIKLYVMTAEPNYAQPWQAREASLSGGIARVTAPRVRRCVAAIGRLHCHGAGSLAAGTFRCVFAARGFVAMSRHDLGPRASLRLSGRFRAGSPAARLHRQRLRAGGPSAADQRARGAELHHGARAPRGPPQEVARARAVLRAGGGSGAADGGRRLLLGQPVPAALGRSAAPAGQRRCGWLPSRRRLHMRHQGRRVARRFAPLRSGAAMPRVGAAATHVR